MKKKEKGLLPIIIKKDCIQAAITFDCVAVISSDHSLWLLHPFTSRMHYKFRERRRDGRRSYWDETEFGPKPRFKKLMENVSMVSATAMSMAVVKTDGSLLVWDRMQTGSEDKFNFVKIADGIKTAEAGEGVLLAISQDGTLLCWEKQEQNGYFGQQPEKIMEHVIQVSAGVGHYGALREDGSLWMWGQNDCGQLGDGSHINRASPEKIMEHVTQVSLGARHSAAVDEKHRLWMWGDNTLGQLGTILPGSRRKPVRVMENVKKVSLGYSHTGVLDLDRQFWMCGFNGKYGALGNMDMRNCRRFQKIRIRGSDLKNFVLGADRTVIILFMPESTEGVVEGQATAMSDKKQQENCRKPWHIAQKVKQKD